MACAVAAAAAVATLAGGTSAGVAASENASLTTRAGAERYLASLGVDARGVVVQRGRRNYAGARCPGRGWTCTKARRVLQLGAVNAVECVPGTAAATPSSQTCTIVQSGPGANRARCIERSGAEPAAAQDCTIVQSGRNNDALVLQIIDQSLSASQTAIQTATVTQTTSGKNSVHVTQAVRQRTSVGATQQQDAEQVATVDQTATGAGDNQAHVRQSERQRAFGGETQRQNADDVAAGDCAPGLFSTPDPNACANVEQASDTGKNQVHLRQTIDEDASTPLVAVQQQGSPSGGIDARVHQETATGTSTNDARQEKRQRLSAAPGSTQTQFDPTSCCGIGSQVGGEGNREAIDQRVTQVASEGASASQAATVIGASVTPAGACAISQSVRNEGGSANESMSLDPCPFLVLVTACASEGAVGEGEGGCTTTAITSPPDDAVCLICAASATTSATGRPPS